MVTLINEISDKIESFDVKKYSYTRNFVDGDISLLSPYISRGVISTKQIFNRLKQKHKTFSEIEKYVQELAWRDYFQLIFEEKDVTKNLKNYTLSHTTFEGFPIAFRDSKTGIEFIDNSIRDLYETGYMHNHVRMYVASLICNFSNSHFLNPSKWMYYHLLDGDIASNCLNWQWISGASRNKKYLFNQENLNKYSKTKQRNTFIDISYEHIEKVKMPEHFDKITIFNEEASLPKSDVFALDNNKPLCIYNYYNLDPYWRSENDYNRVLLFEPSIFKKFPVGKKAIDFALKLSNNIPNIKIYCGEFDELVNDFNNDIFYKQHPLNYRYKGFEESRDWLTSIKGYYPSFFSFWKKAKKELIF